MHNNADLYTSTINYIQVEISETEKSVLNEAKLSACRVMPVVVSETI